MIQQAQSGPPVAAPPPPGASARLWGLSARQLHDAYWHARGVQCIRRGARQPWQSGAELYLLIEPNQLVAFDLSPLSDRLTWHNALVTRLRLIDENEIPYSEHVAVDREGLVQRIERRYRPKFQGSSRVILTPTRRIARIWMNARTRREGWDRVRRSVAWSRVDHWKCAGVAFVDGNPQQERRLIDELVERWPDPGRAIAGIEERETGVWHPAGQSLPDVKVRVGPLWLGFADGDEAPRCLVGPRWTDDRADAPPDQDTGIAVREIMDIELADRPRSVRAPSPGTTYAALKRASDIVVSFIALIVGAPVMAVISLAILIDDGPPVFYGQRRQGRGGRSFRCWKYRTMFRDADRMVRELEDRNVCDGPQIFIRDDPRVTRVGRLLRRLHLDELPQFLNVLLGQMSIVGPRPSPDDENQFCPAWRDVRLSVRPGITGLWQLNRTREPGEDFQEWIKYDIEYVQRVGFFLDLSIVARTAWTIIFGRSDRASDQTR